MHTGEPRRAPRKPHRDLNIGKWKVSDATPGHPSSQPQHRVKRCVCVCVFQVRSQFRSHSKQSSAGALSAPCCSALFTRSCYAAGLPMMYPCNIAVMSVVTRSAQGTWLNRTGRNPMARFSPPWNLAYRTPPLGQRHGCPTNQRPSKTKEREG